MLSAVGTENVFEFLHRELAGLWIWNRSTSDSCSPSFPRMAKSGKQSAEQDVSFEEAMEKLESVVGSMESDELPLEKLLAQYELGTKLVAKCQEKLEAAELKIRKLEDVTPTTEE